MFIRDQGQTYFQLSDPNLKLQLEKDLVLNIFQDGKWGTYRHIPLNISQTVPLKHVYLNTIVRGDLSTLRFIEAPVPEHW